MNYVLISGKLTGDSELRTTKTGLKILSFSMAVTEPKYNRQTQSWDTKQTPCICNMFGKKAEDMAGSLTSGVQVSVAGKLYFDSWEKDGQEKGKLEVTANEVMIGASDLENKAPEKAYDDSDIPF